MHVLRKCNRWNKSPHAAFLARLFTCWSFPPGAYIRGTCKLVSLSLAGGPLVEPTSTKTSIGCRKTPCRTKQVSLRVLDMSMLTWTSLPFVPVRFPRSSSPSEHPDLTRFHPAAILMVLGPSEYQEIVNFGLTAAESALPHLLTPHTSGLRVDII